MQVAFEDQWKELSQRDKQPDLMGETIGVFTTPDYVQIVGPAFYFRGTLPEDGNLNAQDEMVMRDIYMWTAGMNREQWVWDEAHKENKS